MKIAKKNKDAKLIRCLVAEFDKKVSETPEAFIIHRIKFEDCQKNKGFHQLTDNYKDL